MHLYPSQLLHMSRILRITEAVGRLATIDSVTIVGASGPASTSTEVIDSRRRIVRVAKPYPLASGLLQKSANSVVWSWLAGSTVRPLNIRLVAAHSLAVLPVAWQIRQHANAALLYLPHELETETSLSKGFRRALSKTVERTLIHKADGVVVVGDSIADWYQHEYDIPRPLVVRNLVDVEKQQQSPGRSRLRGALGLSEEAFVFIYQGGLFPGRRIEQLLRIFQHTKPDRHVVFMGMGEMSTVVKAAADRHPNIHFVPAVESSRILGFTQDADVGIVGVENVSLSYYFSLPNKLFEYVAAGVPMIAPAYPDMERFITQYACGWTVGEEDDVWISRINSLVRDDIVRAGQSARFAASQNLWSQERDRFVEFCNGVMVSRSY